MDEDRQDELLGRYLVQARELEELSIFEVPKLSGIDGRRLLELESGRPKVSLKLHEAKRLAATYNIPLRRLLSFFDPGNDDGPIAS